MAKTVTERAQAYVEAQDAFHAARADITLYKNEGAYGSATLSVVQALGRALVTAWQGPAFIRAYNRENIAIQTPNDTEVNPMRATAEAVLAKVAKEGTP